MKLIVGLGNPGIKYDKTRHNVGFMVIDRIAKKLNVVLSNHEFNGFFYHNSDFILAKPNTYMNLSGNFVLQIANYYKINAKDILIIRDDLDTSLGQAKIKLSGGAGGHNGMKHIINSFSSEEMAQLKLGIDRPKNKAMEIASYVLADFDNDEKEVIDLVIDKAADAAISCIYNGYRNVMNNFNYQRKKDEINSH